MANSRIASLLDPDDRHASQVMPQSMVLEGEELRAKLTTKASARVALAGASVEPATELTPQHVNRLAQHVEAVMHLRRWAWRSRAHPATSCRCA